MMKIFKYILLLVVGISLTTFAAFRPDIYAEISEAIRNGEAKEVAKFFDNNVNITILGQEDIYSKAQAELVLQNFFSKNNPRTFTLVHEGGPASAGKFVIGTLSTNDGKKYRVTIHIKKLGVDSVIQELRIESE